MIGKRYSPFPYFAPALEIFNNTFSKKNAVKLEPICVNKPVKDVHRNIKIYDNEIGE